MPRYAIDTIQCTDSAVIIKVVFFDYDYKSNWMNSKKGGLTVPSTMLRNVVVEQLKEKGTLDYSLFAKYIARSEQGIVEHLIEKGNGDGASQRAQKRMAKIFDALRAIIVADELIGSLRVQCLNKDNPIATYDAEKKVVKLDGLTWDVAQAFASAPPKPPTPPTPPVIKEAPVEPQKPKNPEKPPTMGGTVRTFGTTTDRGTGVLTPKSPFVRWWQKHRFAVYSFVFFFVLSSAIVYGLLRLQKSIESLPDQPRQPRSTLATDTLTTTDSLAPSTAPMPSADSTAKPRTLRPSRHKRH